MARIGVLGRPIFAHVHWAPDPPRSRSDEAFPRHRCESGDDFTRTHSSGEAQFFRVPLSSLLDRICHPTRPCATAFSDIIRFNRRSGKGSDPRRISSKPSPLRLHSGRPSGRPSFCVDRGSHGMIPRYGFGWSGEFLTAPAAWAHRQKVVAATVPQQAAASCGHRRDESLLLMTGAHVSGAVS
jgi:hypothetical protein